MSEVRFSDIGVECTPLGDYDDSMLWSSLIAVVAQTTDQGPLLDDLFIVLVGDNSCCWIPSESQGFQEFRERLTELPGFNFQAAIEAATCTQTQEFLLWHRDSLLAGV